MKFWESEERKSIDKALDKLDLYDLIEFITVASDRGKNYIIRNLVAKAEKLQRIKSIIND